MLKAGLGADIAGLRLAPWVKAGLRLSPQIKQCGFKLFLMLKYASLQHIISISTNSVI